MSSTPNPFDDSLGGFIDGMRHHDLAKPFFLGKERHAPAGFFLLTGGGETTAGLYALLHHANTIGLEKVAQFLLDWHGLKNDGDSLPVPAWVFLSPWLDQLAASTYSGATRDPRNQNIWSFQNPFSRLPRQERVKTYGKQNHTEVQKELWQKVGLDGVYCWDEMKEVSKEFDDSSRHQGILQKLTTCAPQLSGYVKRHRELLPARLFPERTYPSANDTPLLEHGQLTAALALVVGGNILLQQPSGFNPQVIITRESGGQIMVAGVTAAQFSWDDYQRLTLQHLQGRLVRISFAWYEELFQQAIRLDDIHGVKNFLAAAGEERLMQRFKDNFHKEIGTLFGADQHVAPALEPLNDFPFDLVYLLPGAIRIEQIKDVVRQAYTKAVETLAKNLQKEYDHDFNGIKEIPKLDCSELQKQLLAFAPFCYLEEIKVDSAVGSEPENGLKRAKQSLSEQTLKAYSLLWQAGKVSRSEAELRLTSVPSIPAPECCEVCGLHAVFEEFYRKYEEFLQSNPSFAQIMEKVIYGHKEEPERLCRACLGRRLWSHGEVQERWLRDILEQVEQDDTVLVRLKADPLLAPPPKLLPRLEIPKEGDLPEDMGAAFVRCRGGGLQVYPTLAAAADADGNLALLSLSPNWQRGILAELSQVRAAAEALQCAFFSLDNWAKNHSNLSSKIEDWEHRKSSGTPAELTGAKNQCCHILDYLKTWPNHISWHPLAPLADLVTRLNPLDPAKEPDEVRGVIGAIIKNWEEFLKPYYTKSGASDLERFEAALVEYIAGLTGQDVQEGFRDEALLARPHLARVLTRIRWVHEFFQDLPKVLVDEGGIRTLTLESAYPRLVVAVPAADLIQALRVLQYTLTHNLFSSTLYEDEPPCPTAAALADGVARQRREALSLKLLEQILPPVLLGAVVIFKERQPLYHILATARRINDYLAQQPDSYCGILLGLTDWRPCLGAMTPEQARDILPLDFVELYHLLDNEGLIARRPLFSLAQAAESEWGRLPEYRAAMLAIKQRRQQWPDRVRNRLQNDKLFNAMVFFKRTAKA